MSPPPRRAVPRFGARVPGAVYGSRPSAYLVLSDPEGRLAVVRTPKGAQLAHGSHRWAIQAERLAREGRAAI